MFLLVLGAALALSVLWAVSVGSVRELRRARRLDPRTGCQAWVPVRGLGGRRYRCGAPTFADLARCRRHAHAPADADLDDSAASARDVDEPAAVGRALAQARIGVPLAVLTVVAVFGFAAQAILQRGA